MRKISFIFFLFFSVMSFTFSSFAGVASGSNAGRVPRASWSNASHAWEDFKDSFDRINDVDTVSNDIALSVSGLPTFDNTVNYSGVRVGVYYEDVLKKRHWAWSNVGSDGWYNIVKPDDYARIINVVIRLSRSAIPSSGKYTLRVRNSVQGGGSNYITKYFFYVEKSVSNATAFFQNINLSGQSNFSEYYIEDSVNLPTSYSYMNVTADYDGDHSFGFPFNGAVKIQFASLDNSASTSVNPTAGSGVNDTANNTADIANNSARQVEQGDSIIELIKNTIQTISSQLESFWNQLAGEFTNLYNKMNQQHSEDLAKVDEQISADRQNTDDLINNQDKNTDQITDGFDSSGMNSANDKLNGQLSDYDSKEKEVLDQVNEKVDSFEFEEPLSASHFVGPLEDIRYFLTGVYNGYSSLNIPIGFSLTLTIALIVIGYYRFKGGS